MSLDSNAERELFEAAIKANLKIYPKYLDRDTAGGGYFDAIVQNYWQVWQLARAHQQDSLPVEAITHGIDELDNEQLKCIAKASAFREGSESHNKWMAAAKVAETHADALRALLPPNTEAK